MNKEQIEKYDKMSVVTLDYSKFPGSVLVLFGDTPVGIFQEVNLKATTETPFALTLEFKRIMLPDKLRIIGLEPQLKEKNE